MDIFLKISKNSSCSMSKVNPLVLDDKIKIKSIKENAEYNFFYSYFCTKKGRTNKSRILGNILK